MTSWRQAGLNYINYSNIAAKLLRQALKPDLRADAMKRADTHIKITKWENGKPIRNLLVDSVHTLTNMDMIFLWDIKK